MDTAVVSDMSKIVQNEQKRNKFISLLFRTDAYLIKRYIFNFIIL